MIALPALKLYWIMTNCTIYIFILVLKLPMILVSNRHIVKTYKWFGSFNGFI